MSKILVVEDNADLAFALTTTLELEGFEVQLASSGPDAVAAACGGEIDVIVLDVMLPGFDGFRVLRTLREGGNDAPVLILTARGEEADRLRGFRLGADDYLTKPFAAMELVARISALIRRAGRARAEATTLPVSRHEVIRFGALEVTPSARMVRRGGEVVALRPREVDLLLALLRRNGAVATRQELLQEVWGYGADVVSRTIDIHIAELRRKLEDNPAEPRHILTVVKAGYRIEL